MLIWELRYDGINEYAVLVPGDPYYDVLSILGSNGKPKRWESRPKVEPFIEKHKKKAKPRADLSYLIAGSITLNQKAYLALKDFLLPFGELLELDCNGDVEYFYNITNLVSCIDYENSEKMGTAVIKEAFFMDRVPTEAMFFKDPYTARSMMYANQAGKEKFEQLAAEAGLFGARFVPAGHGLF